MSNKKYGNILLGALVIFFLLFLGQGIISIVKGQELKVVKPEYIHSVYGVLSDSNPPVLEEIITICVNHGGDSVEIDTHVVGELVFIHYAWYKTPAGEAPKEIKPNPQSF